jgi:glutamyl-tRNA synthetase
VVKPDGTKISKRNGDAMFDDMIEEGYLPEAILNYTVLLGWSPGGEREFFTIEELEKEFTLSGISKSPSTLDYNKLRWMNGEYLRKMTPEDFADKAKPWILKALPDADDEKCAKIASMLQKRTEALGEIPDAIGFLAETGPIDPDLYYHKKMKSDVDSSRELLPLALDALEKLESWDHDRIYSRLSEAASSAGVRNGKLMWPVRVALTGKPVTPGGAIEIADILGRKETLDRMKSAIRQLEE